MRTWWVLLFVTGCIHDSLISCGELVCSADAVCTGDRCVPHEALVACDRMAEGTACMTPHIPAGVCHFGECVAAGCGNGVVEANEACDDGNTTGGDGCSALCDELDVCPPLGKAPQYSRVFQQPISQACSEYTISETSEAVAYCTSSTAMGVSQGAVDSPMMTLYAFAASNFGSYEHPRLAPEADTIFAMYYNSGGSFALTRWLRANDGTWAYASTIMLPPAVGTGAVFGTPTRGPLRHVMALANPTTVLELVIDDTESAVVVATITASQLDTGGISSPPNLTPDGLRMVFTASGLGGNHVFYADRSTIDAAFSAAIALVNAPATPDPFMTANCGRLYFSGLGSVMYVQQR